MKFTITSIIFALFFTAIEYFFGHDITDALRKNDIFLDVLFLLPFIIIGVGIDRYYLYKNKKEAEKIAVYVETLKGVNHHLRNLINNMQIIKCSDTLKNSFGNDIIDLLQKTEDETISALNELQNLTNITPQNIKQIYERNIAS